MPASKDPSRARDAMAELIRYNARFVGKWRDPGLLRSKLDRLCASPFGFFRGTFHLFVSAFRSADYQPVLARAAQPIVGDAHLENFGAFRAEDGSTRFDVNDFDEAGSEVPALDLARLATSIVLAAPAHTDARVSEAIESFVEAWLDANESSRGDLLQTPDEACPIRHLLAEAADGDRRKWVEKRVETVSDRRRFRESGKYLPIVDPVLASAIEAGVRTYADAARSTDLGDDWPRILDYATRVAGTGSLGRFRWAVLIESKNRKLGRERVLELKEALPSALHPHQLGDPAEHVIAQQRLLQAASPAFLGVAHVAGVACTVRELQPTETKADVTQLQADDLAPFCAATGSALGRLHRRGSKAPVVGSASSARRTLTRSTIAFAFRYAEVVMADREALLRRRDEVEEKLGL